MSSARPTLYCHDGSPESERALATGPPLIDEGESVVITVWQPLHVRVAESGGFAEFVPLAEDDVDARERDAAEQPAGD